MLRSEPAARHFSPNNMTVRSSAVTDRIAAVGMTKNASADNAASYFCPKGSRIGLKFAEGRASDRVQLKRAPRRLSYHRVLLRFDNSRPHQVGRTRPTQFGPLLWP